MRILSLLLLAALALACSAHQAPPPPPVNPKPAPQETGGGVASVSLLTTNMTRPLPDNFRFARFFNKLQSAVYEHWHPDVEYLRTDPSGGNLSKERDRLTIVRIRIKPNGSLDSCRIERSSGLDWLDREAIAAVRRAQPFERPPEPLIDEDGVMSFRFGFSFEAGAGKRTTPTPP